MLEPDNAEREAKLNKMIDDIRNLGVKDERIRIVKLVKEFQATHKGIPCEIAFGELLNVIQP